MASAAVCYRRMLPAGVDLTLTDLQEMATRQQQQIESQQQMLVAKEQRLKFLKQQEKKHQQIAAENDRLRKLREKVESQEQKLRKLRSIRGQVDGAKLDNSSLTSELETIRQLFNEKEKELALAVAKVEDLTDQLEVLRKGKLNGLNDNSAHTSSAVVEIERLRKELLIRNKLNEQQSSKLQAQQRIISEKSDDVGIMDKRIEELTERLRKKRAQQKLHQQQRQPSPQQQQPLQPQHQQQHSFHGIPSSPAISLANGFVTLPRTPTSRPTNIAAIEPYSVQAPTKNNKEDPAKDSYPIKPKLVEVEKLEDMKSQKDIKPGDVDEGKKTEKGVNGVSGGKNVLLAHNVQSGTYAPTTKGLVAGLSGGTATFDLQQDNADVSLAGIRGQPEGNTESSSDTASMTDNSSLDNAPIYPRNSKPENAGSNSSISSSNNSASQQPATTTYVAPYIVTGVTSKNASSTPTTSTFTSHPPQTLPKPHPAMQGQRNSSPKMQRDNGTTTGRNGKPKPPVPMKPMHLPLNNNDPNRKLNGSRPQNSLGMMPQSVPQQHPPSPGQQAGGKHPPSPITKTYPKLPSPTQPAQSYPQLPSPNQAVKPPSPGMSRPQQAPAVTMAAGYQQHPPSPHMISQAQHPSSPVWQKRTPEVPPKAATKTFATVTVPPDSVQRALNGNQEVLTYRPPATTAQQMMKTTDGKPAVYPKPQVSAQNPRLAVQTKPQNVNQSGENTPPAVTAVGDALSILLGSGNAGVRSSQDYQRYTPNKPTVSTTFTTITPPVEAYQKPGTTLAGTTRPVTSQPIVTATTMAPMHPPSPTGSRTQNLPNTTTATATVKPMYQDREPIYDIPRSQPIHPAYRDQPPPHYTQATSRSQFPPPPSQTMGQHPVMTYSQPGGNQGKQVPLQSQYLFPKTNHSNKNGQNSPPYEASNDPNRRPPSPVKYPTPKYAPGFPPLKPWDAERLRNIPRPLRRRHSYTEEKEAMPMVRPPGEPGEPRERSVSESDTFYQPDRPLTTFNSTSNMDPSRRTFYQQPPPQQQQQQHSPPHPQQPSHPQQPPHSQQPPHLQSSQQQQQQQPEQNNPVPQQNNHGYPNQYAGQNVHSYRAEIQPDPYDCLEPSPQQYRAALSQVARSSAMESLQVRQHYSSHQPKKSNLKKPNGKKKTNRVSFDPLALLLDASLEGEFNLVRRVIGEVPNPSGSNDEGITALHNAICAGHYDIVTFLVDYGCDVNSQDSDGWTPLHCAASCNNLAMVKFLVERGACIFATTISDVETAAEKCEEDEEGFDGCSEYLYGVQEKLGIMNKGVVYSVYDYEAENPDEFSFREGDAIVVMRRGDEDEREWWWARKGNREGYVPRNLLGLFPRIKPRRSNMT
ncbi:apoptosis-stimulating of p53 protein 2-like isoform X2 [Glandiceps talaboti]